jgi:hypothetical protein
VNVEITSEKGHRALLYVAAVQRHGYVPTVDEFEAYIGRPTPRDAVLMQARQRRLQFGFQRQLRDLFEFLQTQLPGLPDEPPELADPGETVTQWLTRLRWLVVEDGRVKITPLGQAVLAHLEAIGVDADIPVAVVLDPKDELALARVVGELSGIGRGALIDPYFSIQHLLTIVHSTRIDRVLMGTRDQTKLAAVEVALESISAPRRLEVRKSDAFHDRMALPESGPILLIGTSLTGVGARLSMMVRLDESSAAGEAIRGRFEQVWGEAVLVGTVEPQPESGPEPESGAKPAPDATDGKTTEPDHEANGDGEPGGDADENGTGTDEAA